MKVKQLRSKTKKIGKYSKLACNDSEEFMDEEIVIAPEVKEEVAENADTAFLEVLDVVELDSGEEVVVVETPEPDDETIKVQSTETGVTADLPVAAFSKGRKISRKRIAAFSKKGKVKGYSEGDPEVEVVPVPDKVKVSIEQTDAGFTVKVGDTDPVEVTDEQSLLTTISNALKLTGVTADPSVDPKVEAYSRLRARLSRKK